MAAAITFSGGTKALTTVTGSMSGFANTTAHTVTVTALGHTQTIRNVTTDGSGNATFTFVPWTAATFTVTATPAASVAATATLNVGGHG